MGVDSSTIRAGEIMRNIPLSDNLGPGFQFTMTLQLQTHVWFNALSINRCLDSNTGMKAWKGRKPPSESMR
jgi:hypothetical protein